MEPVSQCFHDAAYPLALQQELHIYIHYFSYIFFHHDLSKRLDIILQERFALGLKVCRQMIQDTGERESQAEKEDVNIKWMEVGARVQSIRRFKSNSMRLGHGTHPESSGRHLAGCWQGLGHEESSVFGFCHLGIVEPLESFKQAINESDYLLTISVRKVNWSWGMTRIRDVQIRY